MSLVVLEEKHPKIVEVILNRPEKMNALNWDLIDELTDKLEGLTQRARKNKDLIALIIRSASEKAFCAGADLTERLSMNDEKVLETLDKLKKLTTLLDDFPMPTLAVIEGVAFGGGLELALCCDFRFFSSKASVGLTETRLAIIPGAGGTQRLTRIIGQARSLECVLMAKKIEAQEAYQWGLTNYLGDDALEVARHWALELTERGPVALASAKVAIKDGATLEMKEAIQFERGCYLKTLETEDRLEGLKAFSEKRKPTYLGK